MIECKYYSNKGATFDKLKRKDLFFLMIEEELKLTGCNFEKVAELYNKSVGTIKMINRGQYNTPSFNRFKKERLIQGLSFPMVEEPYKIIY